eukprot:TRINITY_DN2405_c0_g1_i1.p1 TRINITY_DN2405_c0_g1~~TRINITY_DN2405_c0_g1_i1.p1  ORF type:complete len:205 (+),score=32.19 TRINITY_DN2405_c0_g1_i1:62-676(+)
MDDAVLEVEAEVLGSTCHTHDETPDGPDIRPHSFILELTTPRMVNFLEFENYYAAQVSITTRRKGSDAWSQVVRDVTLMNNVHVENEGQLHHRIPFDFHHPVTEVRVFFWQPSPVWKEYGLRNVKLLCKREKHHESPYAGSTSRHRKASREPVVGDDSVTRTLVCAKEIRQEVTQILAKRHKNTAFDSVVQQGEVITELRLGES